MPTAKLANGARVIALFCVTALTGCHVLFAQTVLPDAPGRSSDKRDVLYQVSRYARGGSLVFDSITTWGLLHHPTVASRTDGSYLIRYRFVETQMPGNFFGNRNAAGVIAKNAALDLGIDFLAERLHRKGGTWAKVATGLNFLQTANRVRAGISNARLNAGVNERVRAATGYQGRIVWSH